MGVGGWTRWMILQGPFQPPTVLCDILEEAVFIWASSYVGKRSFCSTECGMKRNVTGKNGCGLVKEASTAKQAVFTARHLSGIQMLSL